MLFFFLTQTSSNTLVIHTLSEAVLETRSIFFFTLLSHKPQYLSALPGIDIAYPMSIHKAKKRVRAVIT